MAIACSNRCFPFFPLGNTDEVVSAFQIELGEDLCVPKALQGLGDQWQGASVLDGVVLWIHIPDLRIEIDGVIFSYYLFLFSVSYKEGSKVLFAPGCLFPLRFFPVPLLITRTLTFCPYPHTQLPLALLQYSTPSAFGRRCNYTIPGL